MPTLVCVPIMVREIHAALADARAARDAGADVVEFRIDEFFAGDGPNANGRAGPHVGQDSGETRDCLRLLAESPLPCIITCRAAAEGGHYDGDDDARVALYERLGNATGPGEHPPRWIDVELATYTRAANIRQKIDLAVQHPRQLRDLRTSLILSAHDFEGRPGDLLRRLARMQAEPAAAVLKIAYRARSLRDSLELLDLIASTGRPTIALGMGEFGLLSRVLAPKFGGFLTFASLHDQTATAPGQPTIRDLLGLYRFRSIRPSTRVYGVVGWPVAHSKSPLLHNAGFEAVGHDGVYLPLPIVAGGNAQDSDLSLKATLLELVHHPTLGFGGCSVTIPHKEGLVRLAREQGWTLDATSEAIGAGNTLVVARDGRGAFVSARVLNTDAPAAGDALRAGLGTFAGKTIGVLGAGGVARAVAYAVGGDASATVIVFSRDRTRAVGLVDGLAPKLAARLIAGEWSERGRAACHAFVNCTPVGMSTGPDPTGSPLDVASIPTARPGTVVMDTVYSPVRTPLLIAAAAHGWTTIDGLAMFTAQAALQFEAWTDNRAPKSLFERVLRESLESS